MVILFFNEEQETRLPTLYERSISMQRSSYFIFSYVKTHSDGTNRIFHR